MTGTEGFVAVTLLQLIGAGLASYAITWMLFFKRTATAVKVWVCLMLLFTAMHAVVLYLVLPTL